MGWRWTRWLPLSPVAAATSSRESLAHQVIVTLGRHLRISLVLWLDQALGVLRLGRELGLRRFNFSSRRNDSSPSQALRGQDHLRHVGATLCLSEESRWTESNASSSLISGRVASFAGPASAHARQLEGVDTGAACGTGGDCPGPVVSLRTEVMLRSGGAVEPENTRHADAGPSQRAFRESEFGSTRGLALDQPATGERWRRSPPAT